MEFIAFLALIVAASIIIVFIAILAVLLIRKAKSSKDAPKPCWDKARAVTEARKEKEAKKNQVSNLNQAKAASEGSYSAAPFPAHPLFSDGKESGSDLAGQTSEVKSLS